MCAQRAKGTRAETSVARYLKEAGWPYMERRARSGAKDRGDLAGMPGVIWEIKAGARLLIPEWLRQTEIERVNDDAQLGILLVKPRGVGDARVGDWWTIQPLKQVCELLKEAGH